MPTRQEGDDQAAVLDRLDRPIAGLDAELSSYVSLDHDLETLSDRRHAMKYDIKVTCMSNRPISYPRRTGGRR